MHKIVVDLVIVLIILFMHDIQYHKNQNLIVNYLFYICLVFLIMISYVLYMFYICICIYYLYSFIIYMYLLILIFIDFDIVYIYSSKILIYIVNIM